MHKHFSGTQTMQALKEETSQNFKWTCNGCKQNVPCMTGLSLQLKSIEEKTHNKISILEQKMDDIHVDMGEKVKEEVSMLKTVLVNDVKAEIKSSLQNNIRAELKEIEDQKQRALNLIIFNVPESKNENSLERKKFDNDIFTKLCNAIEVVEADVKVSFRLGNPTTKNTEKTS